MKKLSTILAALALASTSAYAATDVTDAFTVTVNFTGACTVETAAADLAFTYAAFDSAKSDSTSTVFKCSRGLAPTFKFDDTNADQTGSAAANLGTAITAEGVIHGVRYTLSGATSKSTTGDAAAAGTGGTGGSDGTADKYTVNISAAIAAGQAGSGAGGSGVHTRTLYITY